MVTPNIVLKALMKKIQTFLIFAFRFACYDTQLNK